MQSFIVSIFTILISAAFSKATTLDIGLVAHYEFNGNSNDSSPNNRNLVIWNPSNLSFSYDTYFNKNVLNISNSTRADYFTSPPALPENLVSNYSFGMWINPAGLGRNFPEWSYLISSTNAGENFMRYGESASYSNLKQFGWVTIEELAAGSWQHVAIVKEGQNWSFYFNGEIRGSVDIGDTSFDKNNYFLFNSGGYQYPFIGSVSDVVIYERALTSSEVAQLVPEPSAISLLAVGLGVVLRRRRRTV